MAETGNIEMVQNRPSIPTDVNLSGGRVMSGRDGLLQQLAGRSIVRLRHPATRQHFEPSDTHTHTHTHTARIIPPSHSCLLCLQCMSGVV